MIGFPTWTIPSIFLYLCALWFLFTTGLHSYWNLSSQVLPSALHCSRNIQQVYFLYQRMTTQYCPWHFILVDFNLVAKRQELLATVGLGFFATHRCIIRRGSVEREKASKIFCMVKVVLWKTTFYTSSKIKTENKREKIHAENFFAKPCNQNYALLLHATFAQSSDPFLSILFWYKPRCKFEAPWGHSTVLQ